MLRESQRLVDAMVADVCFFVFALVGLVTALQRSPGIQTMLFAAGGASMLYFAYSAVGSARSFVGDDVEAGRGFRKALALALTNPFQIAFWLTVGVGLLEPGQVDGFALLPVAGPALAGRAVVRTGSPAIVAGLFADVVVWITGFPAALVAARRRVEAVAPLIAWLSAGVLAGTGLFFLAEAFARL